MYQLLRDPRLFDLLTCIDEDLAQQARATGCRHCGGRLDSADYPRKPRISLGLKPPYERRLSFCCARRDCRRRLTPPSVRFLGRKVYAGVAVLITSMLENHGSSADRRRCREWLAVSRRTVARWRRWWRRLFPQSSFWRSVCGWFQTPVETDQLPASLLACFPGDDRSRLIAALRLLTPITTSSCPGTVTLAEVRRFQLGVPAEHA